MEEKLKGGYTGRSKGEVLDRAGEGQKLHLPFEVIAGFNSTFLKFYLENASQSDGVVYYKDQCVVNINNPVTVVNSPKYINTNNMEFNCSYKLTSYLPSTSIAAVGVQNFVADGKSNVTLTNGKGESITYTNPSQTPDFFGDAANPDIKIDLYVSAAAKLEFVLAIDSVLDVCSGKIPANKNESVFPNLPSSNSPYKCRKLITADSDITISVDKLEIASGFDALNIIDGNTSAGVVGHYFYSATEQQILYISSEKYLIVTLDVRKPFEQKNISIFATTDLASQAHKSGTLTFPKTATKKYWQLIADENKLVKVNFTSLVGNVTVTIYNGPQSSDIVLAVLTPSNSKINPVIGGPEMLVKIEAFNLTVDLTAEFTSVDKGCDHVSTDSSGQWSIAKQDPGTCSCSIFPNVNIPVNVIVLYLDSLKLGEKDNVTIVSGVNSSKVLAQFSTSVSQYQVIGSIQEGLRVIFTKGESGQDISQGSFRYETVQSVCGGNLSVDGKPYTVSTPNFPNQYPLNAQCTWAVGSQSAKTGQVLLFNVEALNLAPGHSLSVKNGTTDLAKFEGTKVPEANLLVPANETKVEFQSLGPASPVASGAKFTYQSYDCGYSAQENTGKIPLPTAQATNCIWIIEVKNTTAKQVIVNITVSAPEKSQIKSSLLIHDGSSLQKELLNYTVNQPVLTRYNTVVVELTKSDDTKDVTLSFQTYECQNLCSNGICLHDDWKCNGRNDCGDNSDEIDCGNSTVPTTPGPTTTAKPAVADYSGYVKSGWVPACLAIGIILGLVLYFAVPRIVNKIRGRGSNYSRMGDDSS
ncbi:hypothetical protein Btru_050232 [Bulinus truncatus]|nr:hypothetical protein Btru_050232 [Bulinus truncatus]